MPTVRSAVGLRAILSRCRGRHLGRCHVESREHSWLRAALREATRLRPALSLCQSCDSRDPAPGERGRFCPSKWILGATDEDQWTATIAGAQPHGDGLKQWIANAPGFRTERIQAPVLIAATDPGHLLPLWGLYAPLRQQGKPVELQYIRGGQHNLIKPLEILAHQELIVDWFDFWLNGHEDPSTGKLEQYRRWEGLRKAPVKEHAP